MRVREGTYAAHMLEHIVIELHTQAGLEVGFGKARMTSKEGVYKMVFRTPDPVVGMACLEAGVRLLHAAIEGTEYDLQAERIHACACAGHAVQIQACACAFTVLTPKCGIVCKV